MGCNSHSAKFAAYLNDKEIDTLSIIQMPAKLYKAQMYAYGPYNKVGDSIFGTRVCNFGNDYPGRNSHAGPVALQYPNGDLVAFYTNCSGHNADGWSEYSVSKDGGRTWSMYNKFDYSYNAYQNNRNSTALIEQGLVTITEGTIILFITQITITGTRTGSGFVRSLDNGQTWSAYQPLDGDFVGYPVATASVGSMNYVLYDEQLGASSGPHVLYVSNDNGTSWSRRSTLSLDNDACYGTMCFMTDGRLIAGAYKGNDGSGAYRGNDEHLFYYCISNDHGVTWGSPKTTYLDKKIRNAKISCLGGKYYLCGRSGHSGPYAHQFVIYQSDDGENWGKGVIVNNDPQNSDGYSNVCIINKGNGPEVMIVYSICYKYLYTNEYVFFIKSI
jgi:hypothetical protein